VLPTNTVLKVILANVTGARAVDNQGDIHVIAAGDFEWLSATGDPEL
jgi:hypothetical protein